MNDFTALLPAFGAGAALGLFYFYGLWYTVRRLQSARWAPLWLLGSGVLRMAVLVVGLYYLGGGDWRRLLAALVGIVLVRLLLTTRIGKPHPPQSGGAGEGSTP